ncbi:MAG: AAA family ATPase, partial [Chloroflexi bacterium]|nr:AAA family ATPase [Chloroflexota bacterium]
MTVPILTTKLYIPHPRPNRVTRRRLLERLENGLRQGHRLYLLSAPAGFGKTTLLSDWMAAYSAPGDPQAGAAAPRFCWFSIDEGDNDPQRFVAYVIAALQNIDAEIGKASLALLQARLGAGEGISYEAVYTALLNDLAGCPSPLLLVLDDYHLIHSRTVHDNLAFLLDHLPPRAHLVIASRSDPPFPLARLRARGQISELRDADLRFTPEESAAFLNQVMSLQLSTADVLALEARTEGWIAGLQLVAHALQGSQARRGPVTPSEFIAAFTGSSRYVLDYLVEEVLRRQSADVQRFLLQTSILKRMTGPLCDALTGRSDGQAMLEMLESLNLFIVPLDQDRTWYRYHHLFTEFLRSRLYKELPPEAGGASPEVNRLHGRAAGWLEARGLYSEATDHALQAGEYGQAVHLIESFFMHNFNFGEARILLGWLEQIPP